LRLIGLDIGTTTICGLLLEAATGRILDTLSAANTFRLPGKQPDEALQDPLGILTAAERIVGKLTGTGEAVAGLGVTGQMHGIVYLDDHGEPVGPLYTWQDARGEREYVDGRTYASFLSEALGSPVSTGFGFVTHYWNIRNGAVPDRGSCFCTIADFVALRLAGAGRPVMDPSNAASLGCFDLENLRFRTDAAAQLGVSPSTFPPVVLDYPSLGNGPGGVPVFAALGDNQASFLGAVGDRSRSVHINIGTGSQLSVFSDRFTPAAGIDLRPFPWGGYLYVGAGLCGGRAYALLHDFFERTLRLFTDGAEGADYEVMNAVGPEELPDAGRVVVDTRFQGTRSEPSMRGSIKNLSPENLTPEHLIVGMREGMASELFDTFDRLPPEARRSKVTMIGSGNGIRLNPKLRNAFERTFGMPMRVPAHTEEAAFGAALLAGVASGVLPDLQAAGALVRYEVN
jgi:sedoheptulokinase